MITAAILICLAPVAYDGDTVRCGTSPTRIRLFAIQAPERGEPGAEEAKAALQATVNGGLICSPPSASYNRIVGLCSNYLGKDVGRALLDAKVVTEWCRYSVTKATPAGYYGTCPRP